MSETVLAALIGAVASIIVCLISSKAQNKNIVNKFNESNEVQHEKIVAELEKHEAVIEERIKNLDEKVEKHNKVIERVYKLEKHEAVIDEKLDHLAAFHK